MKVSKIILGVLVLHVLVFFSFGQEDEKTIRFVEKYDEAMMSRNFSKARKIFTALKKEYRKSRSEGREKYYKLWKREQQEISQFFKDVSREMKQKKGLYTVVYDLEGNAYRGNVVGVKKNVLFLKLGKKGTKARLQYLQTKDLQKWTPSSSKLKGRFYFVLGILDYYEKKAGAGHFAKAQEHGYDFASWDVYETEEGSEELVEEESDFESDEPSQVVKTREHVLYIPSGLHRNRKYPLLVALSPGANGNQMMEWWREVGEKHKWIIYGSNIHRNGVDMKQQVDKIYADMQELMVHHPIAEKKIIVTGFSGGGMCSHAFSFYRKGVPAVVMPNTGMMHEIFQDDKSYSKKYPKSGVAIFLASPTDFRYDEMQRDQEYLDNKGWKTHWIEFSGGHVLAPVDICMEAAEWIEQNVF